MTPRQRAWLLPSAAPCVALGILIGQRVSTALWPLLACALVLPVLLIWRNPGRFLGSLTLAVCLGVLSASVAWHPALPAEGEYAVSGVIADEVHFGVLGQVRTVLSDVTLDGAAVSGSAWWTFYTDAPPEELIPGRRVSLRASVYHPGSADNPGGYDFRETLLRRHILIGVYGNAELETGLPGRFSLAGTAAALRSALSGRLTELMGEEAGAYAVALLLGSRTMIPSEDREAFSRLGLAHILAVSGFHVGILIGLLSFLFRLLRLPQRVRLLLYAVLLSAYSLLCGAGQPVLRASLLTLLALEGRILARPRSGLHLLSAVMIFLLLLSPVQLTGASFLLSFGAVLGITVVLPAVQSVWEPRSALLRRIRDLFAVALGAQLGILAPQLYFYQSLPLLSMLLSVPISLFTSLLIGVDWAVMLCLPLAGIARVPAWVAARMTEGLLQVVRPLSRLEHITLWTPAASLWTLLGVALLLLSVTILIRWPRRLRLILAPLACGLIALSLIPPVHQGTEYIQFSAGNADAALLLDEQQAIVLDAGPEGSVLSGYLRRHRITPDAVILTHLHADHAGGLASLMADDIPIRRLYLPSGATGALIHPDMLQLLETLREGGTEIRTLGRGDALSLPSGSLRVLWPETGRVRPGQDANLSSLAVLLELKGVRLLQTGDLDGTFEAYAAAPADLLKLAHHGSRFSTSPAFLAAVSPQVCLLSCDRAARHAEVAARLDGVPLYSTAVNGALTVRFDQGRFRIETMLSEPPEENVDESSGI